MLDKFRNIFLVVVLGLFLSGCSKEDKIEPLSQDQISLIKNLPYSTQFLLYVNSGELREKGYNNTDISNTTSFGKISNIFNAIQEGTGISVNENLAEFFVANSWEQKDCIILTFNNNEDKVLNYLKNKKSFSSFKAANKIIYKGKKELNNQYYYFINENTLLVADDSSFIFNKVKNKEKNLYDNQNFVEIINGIKYKKHYWTASNQGQFLSLIMYQFLSTRKANYIKDFAKNIDNISICAFFNKDIAIHSSMGCRDAKTSFLLTNAVRSAISMDLFAQNNPELGPIFDKIEVERTGKKVNFNLELQQKELQEIKNYINKKKPEKK